MNFKWKFNNRLILTLFLTALIFLIFIALKKNHSPNQPHQPTTQNKPQTETIISTFKKIKPTSLPEVKDPSTRDCLNFSFELSRIDSIDNKLIFFKEYKNVALNCQKKSWFPQKTSQLLNSCLQELDDNTDVFRECTVFFSVSKLNYLSEFEVDEKSPDRLKTTELILKILNSFVSKDISDINILNETFNRSIELGMRDDGPSDLDDLLSVVVMTALSHPDFLKQEDFKYKTDNFLDQFDQLQRLEEVRLMYLVINKSPIEKFIDYIEMYPQSSLGRYYTAGAYWKMNNPELTRTYLEQAIMLDQSNERYRKTSEDLKKAKIGDKIFKTNFKFNFNF